MKLIKIEKSENGSHDNITADYLETIPEGWAVIPDDMETPNLPFGEAEVEEIDGVMTVTKWTAGEMPEPTKPMPTEAERLRADVDYIAIMTGVEL